MSREPRFIDNSSGLVELTSRTLHGLHLLRPSARVNDLILGVLGRAQAKYEVPLHAFTFMSNHSHILATVRDPKQMSLFMGYFNGNVAKELGHVHDWKEKFWGRRYHSMSLADGEEDQIARFLYILSNSCKEGLVASPLEWPGVSSARTLYNGESSMTGTWQDRTAQYRAREPRDDAQFASTETVNLTPLPFLQGCSKEEQRQFVVDAVRQVERETAEMHEVNGTQPLGARAVQRLSPYSKPKEFKRSPAPKIYAVNREVYWTMVEARREKVAAYRDAADRLKQGETDVRFPDGCFPPRLPFVESRAPT